MLSPQEEAQASEQQRIEAFEKEVKKRRVMLRKAKKYSAQERLEAAEWLGESCDPEAITELAVVYEKDPTPGMKEASKAALGKMRALQEALQDPKSRDATLQRAEEIMLYGEVRSGGDKLGLVRRILGISFLVLMVIAVGLSFSGTGEVEDPLQQSADASATAKAFVAANATSTPSSQEDAVITLENYYTLLSQDISVLRQQYGQVSRGEAYDCGVTFHAPPPLSAPIVPENGTVFTALTDSLNTVEAAMRPMREQYETVCDDPAQSFHPDDGRDFDDALVALQRDLVDLDTEINALKGDETPTPFPTPTETLVPTEAPLATLDRSIIRPIILELDDVISVMIDLRGPAESVKGYWELLHDEGAADGCLLAEPVIPEDYVLDETIAAQSPALAEAAGLVNLGLSMTRDARDAFYGQCPSVNAAEAAGRIEQMDVALQAFIDAQTRLNELLSR